MIEELQYIHQEQLSIVEGLTREQGGSSAWLMQSLYIIVAGDWHTVVSSKVWTLAGTYCRSSVW